MANIEQTIIATTLQNKKISAVSQGKPLEKVSDRWRERRCGTFIFAEIVDLIIPLRTRQSVWKDQIEVVLPDPKGIFKESDD